MRLVGVGIKGQFSWNVFVSMMATFIVIDNWLDKWPRCGVWTVAFSDGASWIGRADLRVVKLQDRILKRETHGLLNS